MHHQQFSTAPDEIDLFAELPSKGQSSSSFGEEFASSTGDCAFPRLNETSETDSQPERIAEIWQATCHRWTSTLSEVVRAYARCELEWSLESAEIGSYGQFVLRQPVPTCCTVASADHCANESANSGDRTMMLAIQPALAVGLQDLALAGCIEEPLPTRPLTEIQRALWMVLAERLVASLDDDLCPEITGPGTASSPRWNWQETHHNIQQLRLMRGNTPLCLCRLQLQHDSLSGWLELAMTPTVVDGVARDQR